MAELASDSVGARIQALREELGLSRAELADRADLSKSYIWNLENKPEHQRPSGDTLYALAEALNTTMSELLGRKLLTTPPSADDVSPSLRTFARKAKLNQADVGMLASIKWRGDPPTSPGRWQFVYDALKASKSLDS